MSIEGQKALLQRFLRVKTSTPGNREKQQFEYTFGQPHEEQAYLTMPPAYIRRILAEMDFALRLNAETDQDYAGAIDAALSALEQSVATNGIITISAANDAEAALAPLADAAKAFEVLFAGHAHIDMNWMWGWDETVAITLATFRTVLALMDEYPDFTFSQSQASVYKIVDDYAPELKDDIQKRIKEGRWEVTASAWVETDKNMPDTESLLRHIKETRDYLETSWGVDRASLKVDFSPDTFGHSAFLPELNGFGHVPYYYHCRGRQGDDVLYRWRAPSGAETLIYMEPYWYNSGVTPEAGCGVIEVGKRSGGLKTALIVYGVGDHGGGPTRRDIERVIEMQGWAIFPRVKFGTFAEYFAKAETVREKVAVVSEELNTIFAGCYTTQSRIKRGNRAAEAALLDAEALTVAARKAAGYAPLAAHGAAITGAWQNVLLTHFHDILTGSCVQATREHALGLYQHVMAVAQSRREAACLAISAAVDTSGIPFEHAPEAQSEGAGAGYGIERFAGMPRPERGQGRVRAYHVFNPLPHARNDLVELTVWDWAYDLRRLAVTDAGGTALRFQLIDNKQQHYWDHKYIRLIAETSVPALGYTTVIVRESELVEYPVRLNQSDRVHLPLGACTLENAKLRVTIDGQTGGISSYYDKTAGVERVRQGAHAGLVQIDTETDTSSAWRVGRYMKETPVTDMLRLSESRGTLRQSVTAEHRVLGSTTKTVYSLDDGADELAVSLEINWNETSHGAKTVPVLVLRVPLAVSPDTIRMDVPAGSVDRAQHEMDWAGLTHAAAVYGGESLALISDSKYGYRAEKDTLAVTLINTANSPDPHPERGIHFIKIWIASGESSAKALKEKAQRLTHPVNYTSAAKHAGSLPSNAECLSVESTCTVVTSVGSLPDGRTFVRLYESQGVGGLVTIRPAFPVSGAEAVDLEGLKLADTIVNDGAVSFDAQPYRLYEVRLA